MSVKNLSPQDYNRFIKNNNIDIFSQEKIKNIPRHRLVMMNNGKGGRHLPFNVHGLYGYVQHSNTHPLSREYLTAETRRKIKEKYMVSVRRDLKAMVLAGSKVSEANFIKALKKANVRNTKTLVNARKNPKALNLQTLPNIQPHKIEEVTRLLRGNKNKNNTTKVPNAFKAFAIQQKRKHEKMRRKQQKHQAINALNLSVWNLNRTALARASSIAQKVLAQLSMNPSKTEFKLPELGFKMTMKDDMIVMMWYPPNRKRNRSGKPFFLPQSTPITVPIQAMVFTNYGYVSRRSNHRNLTSSWLVPEISNRIPGSRASAKQMSKAVLLLLKKKAITNQNIDRNARNLNNANIQISDNNSNNSNNYYDASRDTEVYRYFQLAGRAGLFPHPVNRKNIPNIIRKILTALRDENLLGGQRPPPIQSIYISNIEVYIYSNINSNTPSTSRRRGVPVNTPLSEININNVATKPVFTGTNLRNNQLATITLSGNFVSTINNMRYYFEIIWNEERVTRQISETGILTKVEVEIYL